MARQKIIHMKTSVPGRVPTAESIEVGEIAINLPDRQLYSKDGDGIVFPLLPEPHHELTQTEAEDADSEVFGLVSGERLAQAVAEYMSKHGGGGGEVRRTFRRMEVLRSVTESTWTKPADMAGNTVTVTMIGGGPTAANRHAGGLILELDYFTGEAASIDYKCGVAAALGEVSTFGSLTTPAIPAVSLGGDVPQEFGATTYVVGYYHMYVSAAVGTKFEHPTMTVNQTIANLIPVGIKAPVVGLPAMTGGYGGYNNQGVIILEYDVYEDMQ